MLLHLTFIAFNQSALDYNSVLRTSKFTAAGSDSMIVLLRLTLIAPNSVTVLDHRLMVVVKHLLWLAHDEMQC